MASYPSPNLTLCLEAGRTHGPGQPSLKESPGHCLEKEKKMGVLYQGKVGSEKKKPRMPQCPLRLLAASLTYMSSVPCIAKSCVKCIKEMHLKIPSQGQVNPLHKAYDRKKIDSMNSGILRR